MSAEIYKTEKAKGPFDAIVIGSGIGGLATAALLAKSGKAVLVLERHYVAGGFTHTFERKGYEWDVGVHYIGEVHRKNSTLRRILDYLTDGQLQWAKMNEVYDKAFFPDASYEFVAGYEAFREKMCGYFPEEKKAIDTYLALVRQLTKSTKSFFSERALPPWMAKLAHPFLSSDFLKLSRRTTWEVLSSLTQNKKLIAVLCAQYGDYGLPPKQSSFAIHAMIVNHYLDGANYPVGGSSRFFETIAPTIEKAGGKILVRADVAEILTHQNKAVGVRLQNGDELKASLIVSDTGVVNTFTRLLKPETVQRIGYDQKLKKVNPSFAHLCLYIGLKHTAQELNLPQTNYWIFPDDDHDLAIDRYRQNSTASLPVTYISFPSAKDPSWEQKHPGRATMEAIGFAPYEWFSKWENTKWRKRGEDYEQLKKELSEQILKNVYRHVPQVEGKIDYSELSTPLSTQHFANYSKGEIYGLDHTPSRFEQTWLRPHTPIKNLYLTGQDIVSDGIAGAVFAGLLTASAILKKNVIKQILKGEG